MEGYRAIQVPKKGRDGNIEIVDVNVYNILYHRIWSASAGQENRGKGDRAAIYMVGSGKALITDLNPDQMRRVLSGEP
ncbi:MAG: hypothetical protein ACTSPB_04540, partial [Candidatus Thorarchaeota archaeon]